MQLIRTCAVLFCAACAAPRVAHQTIDQATDALEARQPHSELVAAALELADLDTLAIVLPSRRDLADRSSDGYWYGAAYAYAPAVREARARALANLALEESAGAPDPIEVRLVDHEFGGDDTLLESVATFDLLRFLGVGPAKADRQLARSTSLAALADLSHALWEAPFTVDRARIELEAAQTRVALLAALSDEARADLERVNLLAQRGRIGSAPHAVAIGQTWVTEAARDAARDQVGQAKAQLARAAGLPSSAVEHTPAWGLLERSWALPTGLDPDHPALRQGRLELAVAEARLRSVAARTWPNLRVGPHLGFPSGGLDPLRLGGLFSAAVPLPSSWEGPMEAAAVERDRALERYAERVLALRIDLNEARESAFWAAERERAASEAEAASAQAWHAARAAFRNGQGGLDGWLNALEGRRNAVEGIMRARTDRALANLVARRVAGPRPDLQEDERAQVHLARTAERTGGAQ